MKQWPMYAFLYFAQGAAMAYFQNFQKPYLKSSGIPESAIADLTAYLMLPFILKMFFAFLSDRFSFFGWGHRKPYMIAGILIASMAFVLCAINLPTDRFAFFFVAIVTASFGIAFFDSSTDGFAVESTKVEDQGVVQGAMVGGRALGVILMSLLFGSISGNYGYRAVFVIIAICVLIPLIFVLRIREGAAQRAVEKISISDFANFANLSVFSFVAYAIAYSFVSFGYDGVITLHLSKDLGVTDAGLGQYGACRGLGAVLGALLSGYLLTKFNRFGVSHVAMLMISAGIFASSQMISSANFLLMGAIWGVFWGFQETVFVTLAMSKAHPKFAGTSFALLMAFSNVGTSLGDQWATKLSASMDFPSIFVRLAVFGLLVPALLFAVQKTGRPMDLATAADRKGN